MQKTKLTLRIEKPIIELAKRYAKYHNATISKPVSEYLRSLTTVQESTADPRFCKSQPVFYQTTSQ